jgi:hypothetical protein
LDGFPLRLELQQFKKYSQKDYWLVADAVLEIEAVRQLEY